MVGPGRGCFLPGSKVKMQSGEFKEIEKILPREFVKNLFVGNAKVNETFVYEVDEEIIELEFENGTIIKCTKDHKFYTENRGWVEAQYLSEDDEVSEV